MNLRRILIFTASACVLTLPAFVLAQTGFVPLTKDADFAKIFGLSGASMGRNGNDLGSFINGAFKISLSIGAILAVLRIAWAGWIYMSSDMSGEKSHAKEILGDVVIGLLLLLGAYLILYQINPQILNLNIKGLTGTSASAPAPARAPAPSNMQSFSTAPANNSFFGGSGGNFDASTNGLGTGSGCDGAC